MQIWDCTACTFINTESPVRCSACDTPRRSPKPQPEPESSRKLSRDPRREPRREPRHEFEFEFEPRPIRIARRNKCSIAAFLKATRVITPVDMDTTVNDYNDESILKFLNELLTTGFFASADTDGILATLVAGEEVGCEIFQYLAEWFDIEITIRNTTDVMDVRTITPRLHRSYAGRRIAITWCPIAEGCGHWDAEPCGDAEPWS